MLSEEYIKNLRNTNLEHPGVLIEDSSRHIVFASKEFCRIFSIPVPPDQLVGVDCGLAIEESKVFFKESEKFVESVRSLLKNGQISLNEEWELVDGRFLQRDYIPLHLEGTENGHFWKYTDITSQKKANQILATREAKFKGIIDNFHLGLLEVSNDGRILRANEAFCEMIGYAESEIVGKDGGELFLDEEEQRKMRERNLTRRDGEEDVYEVRVFNKKQEPRWWLISAAPLLDDDGIIVGSIGIHWDITHMKELEFELTESKIKAEDSSKAKAAFLANMSHEIRTPLNGIVSMAEQLGQTSLNGNQRYFVDIMRSASSTLLAIINDVLDISKIEAGKFSIENIPFQLNKTVSNTLSIFDARAKDRGIALFQELDNDLNQIYLGDPHRLSQVLFNVVGNAVKFTSKGSVKVKSKIDKSIPDLHNLTLIIEDTGVGMDQNYMDHVFDAFSQEDTTISRKFGGSGLGLSIARSIIQIMGGAISLSSQKGRGTRVEIYIPLRLSNERIEVKSESISSIQARIKGANVLAAEDNELNRMVIQVILRKAGVNLELANDGQQALDLLQKKTFDVVFMDVQMPVKDGIQSTREARELGISTPIIGLSANAMQDKVDVCREAGMDDYLVKPYTEPDLLNMIDKWTSSRRANQPTDSIDEGGVKELDLSMLKQYVGNDESVLKEVISGYLQHLPPQLDRLEIALAGADIMAMRHELHQLKASLEIIGVRPEGCSFQDISTELKSNGLTDFAIAAIKSVIVQGRAGVAFLQDYINK